jgi:hypothetical protein
MAHFELRGMARRLTARFPLVDHGKMDHERYYICKAKIGAIYASRTSGTCMRYLKSRKSGLPIWGARF